MPRRKLTSPRRRPIAQRKTGRSTISTSLPELLETFRLAPEDVVKGLTVGEALLRHKLENKIVETLRHLDVGYPFHDPRHAEFYNRLMALGYAHAGDFVGAEKITARALRDFGPSLDIYFVEAYTRLSMREYDDAVSAASAFERLYDATAPAERATLDLCRTPFHASQVANFLGVAAAQLDRTEQAAAAYRRAINMDPGNHLPYLNLVNLLRVNGDHKEADSVLKQGLKNARQVNELRMFQETLRNTARISACMIVKNEEELLGGCLESIRDWVQEIVVVDTGSTDRTVDIARQYGARVFNQPWTGDFSHHRNYSIEQATGDWIFIIDADERILPDDVPLILQHVNQPGYGILSLNLYNVYGRESRRVTFANSVRFFRRNLNLRYEGIVHNDLVLPKDQPILRTKIRMEHLGYDLAPARMRQKFDRTKALLLKQLEENPDNVFALFNYAELLRGVDPILKPENATEIKRVAGRVVELTDPGDQSKRHLHLMCLNQLAIAALALDDAAAALEYTAKALRIKPNYLDAIVSRGMAFHRLKRYHDAIGEFLHYLKAQAAFDASRETEPIILSHPESRDLAHNNLGILYQITGQPGEAKRHYLGALEDNPTYRETASLLGTLCLREGKREEAEIWFRHQLEHADITREALLGLADICSSDGRVEEAETLLNRAVTGFNHDPSLPIDLGRFLLKHGRFDEAAAIFGAQLDKNSEPGYAQSLADLCFEAGDIDHAAAFYQHCLQAGAASPELLNNLGNCHYRRGSFEEAVQWYRRAVELAPDNVPALRNLGLALVRLGRPAEAAEALRQYLENSPDDAEIAHLLGDQYRTMGKHESAIELYEQVLRQKPTNVAVLFSLSESYLLMGHADSALIGYRRVLQLKPDFRPAAERLAELAGIPTTR